MIQVVSALLHRKPLSLVLSILLQHYPEPGYLDRPMHVHSQIRLPELDLRGWQAGDYRHAFLRNLL
jgi:hypothetical protein